MPVYTHITHTILEHKIHTRCALIRIRTALDPTQFTFGSPSAELLVAWWILVRSNDHLLHKFPWNRLVFSIMAFAVRDWIGEYGITMEMLLLLLVVGVCSLYAVRTAICDQLCITAGTYSVLFA